MNLKDTTQHEIINKLYREAADDLLAMYGIEAQATAKLQPEDANNRTYVSVLGATGEGLALSSLLTLGTALLMRSHPLGPSANSEEALADWSRELNNQLVGRVKNKLLRHGAQVSLGLPVLLTGRDVTAVTGPDSYVKHAAIHTAYGDIKLTLETVADPELRLEEQSAQEEEALLEGAVALF